MLMRAMNVFPVSMNLRIVDKFNLYLSSDQQHSLMQHIHQVNKISPRQFSEIIVNAKAYSLISVKENILLINSHHNDPYDGKISVIDCNRLKLADLNYPVVELTYGCLIECS